MASKTNRTPDGRHVQFGENDPVKMPEGFTAPDDSEFEPGYFGRVMVNPGDGGTGAAYIEPDED